MQPEPRVWGCITVEIADAAEEKKSKGLKSYLQRRSQR